jgi:Domain of unknown function (DU1801)
MSGVVTLPNSSPAVERFLATLDHPLADAIAGLRQAILASDPGIAEHIKWNAPSFRYAGDDRVTFRLPPNGGLQLVFHRGAKPKDVSGFQFDDAHRLLTWVAPDRAIVTFRDAADVEGRQAAAVETVNRWMRATT